MKMISNRDACNWCGRVIELVEGKNTVMNVVVVASASAEHVINPILV